tara:strand:- start:199 stop:612 length:414 start_codon:yes stop_codon:yes gene_type:complete
LKKKISNKDIKDWENFLSNDEPLPNKDQTNIIMQNIKVKSFDLHGYSLDQANIEIQDFIETSYNKGISKIKIITGKGLHSDNEKDPYISKDFGILKNSVPEFIKNNRNLMSMITDIKSADIENGGEGAFYITLKKKL